MIFFQPRRKFSTQLAAVAMIAALLAVPAASVSALHGKATIVKGTVQHRAHLRFSLSFEPNRGQVDPRVSFVARTPGSTVFLTAGGAMVTLHSLHAMRGATLDLRFPSANVRPEIVGLRMLPGKTNYFLGNNPRRWTVNVPTYAQVAYRNLFPGTDLIYDGTHGRLEYDWVLHPGADPRRISFSLRQSGTQLLQERLVQVNGQGNLVTVPGSQDVVQQKPFAYQVLRGVKKMILAHYVVNRPHKIALKLGAYDLKRPVIIASVLRYSSYLGGSDDDLGYGIAVDNAGSAYVTGYTQSINFPTAAPAQAAFGGGTCAYDPPCSDVFVAKLNPEGNALVYSTYLGGTRDDSGRAIALDGLGNAYVTGWTNSPDFPTLKPVQASFAGGACSFNGKPQPCHNAFVVKLSPAGNAMLYSTYLGGTGQDEAQGVAVNGAGEAYVVGQTLSTNFPTVRAVQPSFGGPCAKGSTINTCNDAFVFKLNAAGDALVYSTYLGGSGDDVGRGIALDSDGNAFVTGTTSSSNFPVANAMQGTLAAGNCASNAMPGSCHDAFVTKLKSDGSELVYSTYLGGSGEDGALGIAVDGGSAAYVTGSTNSTNFPLASPLQEAVAGGYDAFISKLNPTGNSLICSTYLGGKGDDGARGVAVDGNGSAYVTGTTSSTDFPTAHPMQPANAGSYDAFVTKLAPTGKVLVYSTYLGGTGIEGGRSITLDRSGNAYITGNTVSMDFPIGQALQNANGGKNDIFVVKIGEKPTATPVPGKKHRKPHCKKGYRIVHGKCRKKKHR